jgi:phosphoribosylanthranilate isomerase
MIVKVCGVRTAAIAQAAIEAGADWIGLVFEPRSPRCASDDEARAVRDAVGARADVIGVFVEPSVDDTDAAAARYRLSGVQVHGAVDESFAHRSSVPVIRGINVRDRHEAFTLHWWPDCELLLDAPAAALPGGTGTRVPVAWAAEVARHRSVILSGGLKPDNVDEAVRAVRPHGVDASSGLEIEPGVKDAALVRAFVRNARSAFEADAA